MTIINRKGREAERARLVSDREMQAGEDRAWDGRGGVVHPKYSEFLLAKRCSQGMQRIALLAVPPACAIPRGRIVHK